jgi:hypothetical protein
MYVNTCSCDLVSFTAASAADIFLHFGWEGAEVSSCTIYTKARGIKDATGGQTAYRSRTKCASPPQEQRLRLAGKRISAHVSIFEEPAPKKRWPISILLLCSAGFAPTGGFIINTDISNFLRKESKKPIVGVVQLPANDWTNSTISSIKKQH